MKFIATAQRLFVVLCLILWGVAAWANNDDDKRDGLPGRRVGGGTRNTELVN